jgi:hypothetical protein
MFALHCHKLKAFYQQKLLSLHKEIEEKDKKIKEISNSNDYLLTLLSDDRRRRSCSSS